MDERVDESSIEPSRGVCGSVVLCVLCCVSWVVCAVLFINIEIIIEHNIHGIVC